MEDVLLEFQLEETTETFLNAKDEKTIQDQLICKVFGRRGVEVACDYIRMREVAALEA